MTTTPPMTEVFCAGGCKTSVPSPEKAGWSFLQITGRWRCGACEGALWRASTQPGVQPTTDEGLDPLPRTDRGALKKIPERPPLHEKPR